jgi:hypothetical protein
VQNANEPQFGLGKSIAFSLILITLTLTGAELLVRGWARYLRDPYQRFDPASGNLRSRARRAPHAEHTRS